MRESAREYTSIGGLTLPTQCHAVYYERGHSEGACQLVHLEEHFYERNENATEYNWYEVR